jgi:hypothetical protein
MKAHGMKKLVLIALLLIPALSFSQLPNQKSEQLKKALDSVDKTGLDMRPVPEILSDFRQKVSPYQTCRKNSDCMMERAGCSSYGVNKAQIKKFRALSGKLQITCGATTKCKAIRCYNKVCTPKECDSNPI